MRKTHLLRRFNELLDGFLSFIYAFFLCFYDGACVAVFMIMIDLYGVHVFPKNHGAFSRSFALLRKKKKGVKRKLKGVRLCERVYIETYHDCVSPEASFICLIFSSSPLRKETICNKKLVKCRLVHIERERERSDVYRNWTLKSSSISSSSQLSSHNLSPADFAAPGATPPR